MDKTNLKAMVNGAYDLQKLRMQAGNRVVANWKIQMGFKTSVKEKENEEKEAQNLLAKIRGRDKRLTDGITDINDRYFKGDKIISDFAIFILVKNYEEILKCEEEQMQRFKSELKKFPIYTEFLNPIVKGVGDTLAGVLISCIDIEKAKYASSIWKYAGLDVADDGKGRSRRKEHLVEVEYKDSDGEMQTKKGITFNPFLKSKLMGVLAGSFLKQRKNGSNYAEIYYNYKNRYQNRPDLVDEKKTDKNGKITHWKDGKKKDLHIHNMAMRPAVKTFLADLYEVWRGLEGLEVHKPYAEAKLGIVHTKVA